MASGHLKTPHQQAEHMAAPTSPCDIVQKTLANSEPSTHARSSGPQGGGNGKAVGMKIAVVERELGAVGIRDPIPAPN